MRSLPAYCLLTLWPLASIGCSAKSDNAANLPTPGEPALPDPAKMVDHPTYNHWGHFPVGTTVTQKTTTDSIKTPGMTVTTIVFVLTEKSNEHVVVTTQAKTEYHGGRVENNPPASVRTPRQIQLPDGIKKEDWGKSKDKGKQSTETLKIAGKEYRAKLYKSDGTTDAGQFELSTWTSEEMPGGLVKSISKVAAVEETTTIEIVEVKIPAVTP